MHFSTEDFPYKRPSRTMVLFQLVSGHHGEKMRYKFLVLFVVSFKVILKIRALHFTYTASMC